MKTLKDSNPGISPKTLEVPAWIAEARVGLTTKLQRTFRAEFSLVVLYGE